MTRNPLSFRRFLAAAAVAAVGLSIFGATAADAAAKPGLFSISSHGTYTIADNGDAVVDGSGDLYRRGAPRKPLAVQVSAVLRADDGTLPAPGECEPGTATVDVTGTRRYPDTYLAGSGDVCGEFLQLPTSAVTHVFTGRYEVLDGRRIAIGTDGWYEVRLAYDGRASVSSFDS